MLFEADQRGADVLETLAGRVAVGEPPVSDYTVALVEGVVAQQERIDELLTTYSQGWSLDRMPAVDRAVLRLGTFELLWRDDVPDAVVISEAVGLARRAVDRRVARVRQRPAGPAARPQAPRSPADPRARASRGRGGPRG